MTDSDRRVDPANQRASSWWEAAKHWYVCSRQHEAVAKGQTARADAAEAKLDEIRGVLVNHAAHAMPYALLHSIHEVVERPAAAPAEPRRYVRQEN